MSSTIPEALRIYKRDVGHVICPGKNMRKKLLRIFSMTMIKKKVNVRIALIASNEVDTLSSSFCT